MARRVDKKLALLTCESIPELVGEDRPLIESFKKLGWTATPVIWTRDFKALYDFDLILFRTVWDYHVRMNEFKKFIKKIDRSKIPIFNSTKIILKNANKKYLKQLSKNGILIPDTIWLPRSKSVDLNKILSKKHWKKAILKPQISASAMHTYKFSVNDVAFVQKTYSRLSEKYDFMLQEFLPEIEEAGELSLFFFAGKYSHSVLKTPKKGDFRVQTEWGGNASPYAPARFVIQTASKITKLLGETVYARIDVVLQGKSIYLMEAELIEPSLFLDLNPKASDNFARAICQAAKHKFGL